MTKRASKKAAVAPAKTAPEIFVPRSLLLSYQDHWSYDDSRFKIGLMARQTGKDFSSGDEGVRSCLAAEARGEKLDWLIAAPSERQSLESLGKWKDWAGVYKLALAAVEEVREGGAETLLKSSTIVFPGGCRVIAVPGKPETVRGFSANVLLTEFAFFENADATWRAILPSITNPLRGGPKKARIISTPNGRGDKFHALWTKNFNKTDAQVRAEAASVIPPHIRERIEAALAAAPKTSTKLTASEAQMRWSCHRVTIYDAVAAGLPVNLFELYAGIDDPEGWAQEFECDFLDSAAVLLPYELIARCESQECSLTVAPEYWQTGARRPLFMGWDFARKKDLSVPWTLERVGDVLVSRELVEMRGLSTPAQLERMRPTLKSCERASVDYTGPGIGLGDYLVKEYGEWKPAEHKFGKIELCTITNDLKLKLFSRLRVAFENVKVRIPIQRDVREDLHSIYRVATSSGGVTYRAPHNEAGHADRCTALALALHAAGEETVQAGILI